MNTARWQFGVYKDDSLTDVYSTDIDTFAEMQRREALQRVAFLQRGDDKSVYRVERLRTGCCIEEKGVVVAQWQTSIDALLPSIEADAARKLVDLKQKNPNGDYVIISI